MRIVRRLDPKTVVVEQPGAISFGAKDIPESGRSIILCDGHTLKRVGAVKLLRAEPGPNATLEFSDVLPMSVGVGDFLFDSSYSPRLLVSGCRFEGNRARGVLAHSNSIIEHCIFANQFEEAVLMIPSASSMDGPAVDDTVIRNNTIEGVDRAGYHRGAIRVGALAQEAGQRDHPSTDIVNHNVSILDNEISRPGGDGISVDSTEDLIISNNTINVISGAAITLSNVRRVLVSNTTCIPPAKLQTDAMSRGEITLNKNSGLIDT
jgi:hypothetical protein